MIPKDLSANFLRNVPLLSEDIEACQMQIKFEGY